MIDERFECQICFNYFHSMYKSEDPTICQCCYYDLTDDFSYEKYKKDDKHVDTKVK